MSERLREALEDASAALMNARNGLDLGLGCARDLENDHSPRPTQPRSVRQERYLINARKAHRAVMAALASTGDEGELRPAGEPREATTDKGERVSVVFVTGSGAQEPVRPVREYCRAFELWVDALQQADRDGRLDDTLKRTLEGVASVQIPIRKSNLLYRLIYLGERLRTERCPEHKGRWSGYGWGRECACQDYEHGGYGPDLTGWLPQRAALSPTQGEDGGVS